MTKIAVCLFAAFLGCAARPGRLLIEMEACDRDHELAWDTLPCPSGSGTAEGAKAWLFFYGIDRERFEAFLSSLRGATIIRRVALYESPHAYEIVVQTQGDIRAALAGKDSWFAVSVEFFSHNPSPFPMEREERESACRIFLYSSPDMRTALLLVGNNGVVRRDKHNRVARENKLPSDPQYSAVQGSPVVEGYVWEHKHRLIARLPLHVERDRVVFHLPKNLLFAKGAGLEKEEIRARTHAMLKPAYPLTCEEIPDFLFLPQVDLLRTSCRQWMDNFSVIWDIGGWGGGVLERSADSEQKPERKTAPDR